MGKRLNVSAGISGRGFGEGEVSAPAPVQVAAERHPQARSDKGRRGAAGATTAEDVPEVNEHLRRDLARVRAKFSTDAPPGQPSLTRAWMSEVAVEEYEAEFVDTVADCMGAGLSLQDALTCWDTGHLALDDAEDSEAGNADDESTPYILPVPRRRPTGGHRLLVR